MQANSLRSGLPAALPIIALLVVQIIFGLNYVASKVILESYPPLLWGAVRMFVSAILMMLLSYAVVAKKDRIVSKSFFINVTAFSFFGIALNQGFFLLGLHLTTPSNSAIINTLTPVFTLILAVLLRREKMTALKGIGFLLAFSGVLVLRNFEDFKISDSTVQGDLFTLLNCLSLAIFFTMAAGFLKRHSVLWATAWMFLFGSFMLAIAAIPDFQNFQTVEITGRMFAAMLYNVVGATIITYYLNSWALAKVHSSQVALFIYLQPVIAVFFAWFAFNEVPQFRMFLAIGMIFCGVSIALTKKRGKNVGTSEQH